MDEIKAIIVEVIRQNQGKCDWQQILDAVDYSDRRYIPQAIESLELENVAKRVNYRHPERGWIMDVQLVGGE